MSASHYFQDVGTGIPASLPVAPSSTNSTEKLVASLSDFYVSYELNAFTRHPNHMPAIYSELHQNIQDKFNEAAVEIMSPHYSQLRDGNQTTTPATYLPKDYQAPSFRVAKSE